jgi:hypothetical protein
MDRCIVYSPGLGRGLDGAIVTDVRGLLPYNLDCGCYCVTKCSWWTLFPQISFINLSLQNRDQLAKLALWYADCPFHAQKIDRNMSRRAMRRRRRNGPQKRQQKSQQKGERKTLQYLNLRAILSSSPYHLNEKLKLSGNLSNRSSAKYSLSLLRM